MCNYQGGLRVSEGRHERRSQRGRVGGGDGDTGAVQREATGDEAVLFMRRSVLDGECRFFKEQDGDKR